jgi:integrase
VGSILSAYASAVSPGCGFRDFNMPTMEDGGRSDPCRGCGGSGYSGRPCKVADAVGHYVKLTRGTKGGRLRHVPVDTPERVDAVARARRVAQRDGDSISDPRYTLVQAIRHLRYVMERFGVTKRDLGVTPHGLRHQYAADEYRNGTGEAPPVEGGGPLPSQIDQAARLVVSERLGHSRVQIAAAYLGSRDPRRRPALRSPT